MKVNPNKMYIVYTPLYRTRKSIFDGQSTTMQELKNKFRRGMDADVIDGIYSTKKEANEAADKLFKKAKRN
ncbi:hypothetical protein ULMA_17290 [Patiriisocius marinus]|jgi:hypothetical protein|uniref:Uncharacterized protein n=1 Tax=Patiriisocius marinus TaxID=1397112 RepID=A0A5J4J1A7_9FLAO|nr:hypothetical protein ULMA_17290 [Patiriisocius marinus]|tara:strand:- start:8087 stop:8299 length:213 start_codon:yes stop_codon:yes gene_type:complete